MRADFHILPCTHPIKQPIFLAGPTAVGKSAVALALAEQIGGEIISVDSMQVYRGLDIGTAKPSAAERARVPHHLIDVAELTEPFDAAKFVTLAQQAVAEIQSRGRVPIFCGGTGLYFKAFLDGLGEAPPSDEKLRAELEATPLAELLRELEQRDPATFARIDRQNPRRVIRAVEVIRLTGKPFSEQRARVGRECWRADEVHPLANRTRMARAPSLPRFVASRARRRISTPGSMPAWTRCSRAVWWKKPGACSSTASRKTKPRCKPSATGRSSSICAANARWPETIELVKIKTRQFAKRQLTWFRKHARAQWIDLKPDDSAAAIAALVQAQRADSITLLHSPPRGDYLLVLRIPHVILAGRLN